MYVPVLRSLQSARHNAGLSLPPDVAVPLSLCIHLMQSALAWLSLFALIAFISQPSFANPVEPSAPDCDRTANLSYTGMVQATDSVPGDRACFPSGALTLPNALRYALLNNPELAAFGWQLRTADARILQASLFPNPALGIEAENIGGSGMYSGLSVAEYTVMISQPILTGGEIDKRTRVAKLERHLAGWDYEAKRLELFTHVAQRFVDVLAAQRKLGVAQQTYDLAQQVYQTVASQVQAGAVSPIEQTRATAQRALSRVDLQRAEHALEAARTALAEVLGLPMPSFAKVTGELSPPLPPPSLDVLTGFLPQNPALARWDTILDKRQAEVELAEAEGLPDLTPGVGVRRFQGTNDTAVIVSLSVPLPLFDRNQGNVQAAEAEVNRAQRQRQAASLRLYSRLGQRYQQLLAAQQAATGLAQQALPAARSAYAAVRTAYQRGERGFLDVLIAQRTLFEIQTRHVDALAEYHRTVAAIERLIGQPLNELTTKDTASPASDEPVESGDKS